MKKQWNTFIHGYSSKLNAISRLVKIDYSNNAETKALQFSVLFPFCRKEKNTTFDIQIFTIKQA